MVRPVYKQLESFGIYFDTNYCKYYCMILHAWHTFRGNSPWYDAFCLAALWYTRRIWIWQVSSTRHRGLMTQFGKAHERITSSHRSLMMFISFLSLFPQLLLKYFTSWHCTRIFRTFRKGASRSAGKAAWRWGDHQGLVVSHTQDQ